ncbi:hypothetical protein EVG20_g4439 [Dentipellis fragilis]|uniref:Uncharacterized protein n=1 Tax=Dentipellis fragilis TaxID=205917 RepID=A0A4Y9YVN4_9AGAM|nr:hypothetical protein EVG20_g4439 [Dentipellis fragilis]
MSYHPYAAARDQRASANSSAPRTSIPTTSYTNISSLPGSSAGNELWDTSTLDIDEEVFPILALIEREKQEAKLARAQGRISGKRYGQILIDCLAKTTIECNKERLTLQRAMRGECSWEELQRNSGWTDAVSDRLKKETERTTWVQMESERRSQARKFPRTVTRGM